MSLASRAGDLYYTFRFLKLLTTPWQETDAFKLGLVDANGKRTREPVTSTEQKTAYTPFHRLVYNMKRLLNKLPGGSSKIASYAAALFLLKEKFDVSEKSLKKICTELNLDPLDFISEQNEWFIMENKQVAPGIYRVRNASILTDSLEDIVKANDKIRMLDNSFPIGDMFGLDIYECVHLNTNKKMYVTLGEIYK